MRLHHLTVSAFGPFAGTERVDFDELNAAGLFLLTGPTGAGKSSLLDAVCFALYGTVPGARGTKALKSQHAPSDAKPEVVLDVTIQGRRLTVRRSPEWSRPKRRGTGVLVEKASASLLETTSGTEHLLSSRAAEVGLLIGELMGMSAAQFVQVALLPQGEFATFLQASSQDRHGVLQQLFRTDRFARIEEWVGEHSRALRVRADVGRSGVQRLLDTVAHRAGVGLPESLAGERLAGSAADGLVETWTGERLRAATREAQAAERRDRVVSMALRAARDDHQQAVRAADLGRRRAAARSTLHALAASETEATAEEQRLSAHERASRCAELLRLRADAQQAAVRSSAGRDRALEAATRTLDRLGPVVLVDTVPGTADDLEELAGELRDRVARLVALAPRERAAEAAGRAREVDLERLAVVRQRQAAAAARTDELPAEIDDCTTALSAATAQAARHDVLAATLVVASGRLDAAVELAELDGRLTALQDERRDARDRSLAARERLQDLVTRRLAGMAAELAARLSPGSPCQVCGSPEHPAPASPADDAVTGDQQQRAEEDVAATSAVVSGTEEALRELQGRHDHLFAVCAGATVAEATAQRAALTVEVGAAAAAADEAGRLVARLRRLRDELGDVSQRRSEGAAAIAALEESVAGHDRLLADVAREVVEELGGSELGGPELGGPELGGPELGGSELGGSGGREPARSPQRVAEALAGWCEQLVAAARAATEASSAEAQAAELDRRALAAATEHGFTALAAVEAAVLADPEVQRLQRAARERADARAAALAVLAEGGEAPGAHVELEAAKSLGTEPAEALGSEAAEALAAEALAAAEIAAAEAAARRAVEDERRAALVRCRDRLADAVRDWAPLRDDSLRAESISRLVRGMGQDNQLQMRLSAYVLATRLDQVVAAANERLGHMREQRYQLQRTDRAERRSSQAGLGLEVVDQWTGDVRAPRTLSGGETFVVSLALALGLADVVTHEAGGTEIETLFVDEGFGTLDADTLDDVMDRLDGLRAGGRTVGVVSHVSELRARIPTQVQVDKGRDGSTVRVRTMVG